jgi:hypothetical protein
MTTYSNEVVLEALRRAQYRQVPWAKRPNVFDLLRALGLHEFSRLSRDERSSDWDLRRAERYTFGGQEAVLEARV